MFPGAGRHPGEDVAPPSYSVPGTGFVINIIANRFGFAIQILVTIE